MPHIVQSQTQQWGMGLNGQGRGKEWALGTPWGRVWGTSQSVIRNGLVEGRNSLSGE